MASLFLTPTPCSSNLSSLKKNPISTYSFPRCPLVKNPNFSFLRSPKTKSRKLLKFSANNNEEETNETESSSMENPVTEDRNSNELERNVSEKLDELTAQCAEREKELDELTSQCIEREKKLEELKKSTEVFLGELEKIKSSSKVPPLKDDKESEVRNESNGWGGSIFEMLDKWDNTLEEWEKSMDKFLDKMEQSLNEEKIEDAMKSRRMFDRMEEEGLLFDALDESNYGSQFKALVRLQKELLKRNDETFGVLDINKLKSCFGFETFFARDVRRDGYGWKVIGRLMNSIEEVRPKLEKKIFESTGKDVVLFFYEDETNDIKHQVCLVELKSRMDFQLESKKLSTPWGYTLELVLCIAGFGTIALMSGSFAKPDAAVDNYLVQAVPLSGGLFSILGVSEIATRITAAHYGVKLSPSFLIPSNWTGYLGVVNNYESLLPSKKALFDIPAARTIGAYLMSVVLLITSFVINGSFNGGDNPLYISPEFFSSNPSISSIQSVVGLVGPYTDLGIALPYTVEPIGVPVDPLAFAGLLGIAVTSLNLLPHERLEGGRIAQALFGRNIATLLCYGTSLLLGIAGLSGSVLCLAWLMIVTIFRSGEEMQAKDEITPLGDERYALGFILSIICFLTFFPNCAGKFSISLPSLPFF